MRTPISFANYKAQNCLLKMLVRLNTNLNRFRVVRIYLVCTKHCFKNIT